MVSLPSTPTPQPATWLDRWFDRIPRLTFTVGARSVPAFRSLGIVGFHLGLVISILAGLRAGLSLVVTLGLSAVAGLSFFGWALLRRAVTERESLVLLEHVWVAIGAVAGYLWVADAPVLGGLDVLVTGLAAFLGMGRIGCLTVGCCHGTPTATGIRYGPAHSNVPPWLVGRRLRPVPLIEAVGLFVISGVGLSLVTSPAGTATAWFLASYAVLRFGTESLRGDRRPRLGGITVARLMALAQLGAAVVLVERVTTGSWTGSLPPPGGGDLPTVAARLTPLAVAIVAGAALQRSRRPDPLATDEHLHEAWRALEATAIEARAEAGRQPDDASPAMTSTASGLSIGVSAVGPSTFHVSLHHPDHDPVGLARSLGADPIIINNGIVHLVIDPPALAPLPSPSSPDGYFAAPLSG